MSGGHDHRTSGSLPDDPAFSALLAATARAVAQARDSLLILEEAVMNGRGSASALQQIDHLSQWLAGLHDWTGGLAAICDHAAPSRHFPAGDIRRLISTLPLEALRDSLSGQSPARSRLGVHHDVELF